MQNVADMKEGSYPQLRETARLRRFSNCACVIDQVDGGLQQLHPMQAFVLSLCDGSLTYLDIAHVIQSSFGINAACSTDLVNATLGLCGRHLLASDQPASTVRAGDHRQFLYEPSLDRKEGQSFRLDYPLEVILRLTEKCNFRCVYCFHGGGATPKRFPATLSEGDVFRLVEEVSDMGVVRFTLTGGEPMLSPLFFYSMELLLRKGIFPYVSTNGSQVDKQCAERMSTAGLKLIQVSLDAGTASSFESLVRVPGAFHRVTDAIKELINAGIQVRVKAVVLPFTVSEVEQLIRTCDSLGVSCLVLDQFMPSRHVETTRRYVLGDADRTFIARIVAETRTTMKVVNNTEHALRWRNTRESQSCGGMRTAVTVHPNGDIGVCELLPDVPDMIFGNIKTDNIRSVWESPKVTEWVNQDVSSLPEPCRSCACLPSCRTGCFAHKLLCFDDWRCVDPRCPRASIPDNPFVPLQSIGLNGHHPID